MTKNKRVLILGGTGEAAALAAKIAAIPGIDAIASFAGRTREPITLLFLVIYTLDVHNLRFIKLL
ncbi:MAG: precorrin-6A/cobalt-precorrin-6A reductase, partial [Microcystis panniformis]